MKKQKGFSLIELVITIMIIIILSLISGPIYRSYSLKAKEAEGYALMGTLRSAQENYYRQYRQFYYNSSLTCNNEVLGIDARHNKYFTSFKINYLGSNTYSFYAYIKGNKGVKNFYMDYNLTYPCKIGYFNGTIN
ncbi:MAG: prepilin-type N-terminal cleavage/methylation domain-containing protein [Elusimicrobia bacterium]|nr:prepilin-type N-terminal cleavage/methylation domain-containing protein [Elusimicrobiota bacterium]